jgi:serine protease AprX
LWFNGIVVVVSAGNRGGGNLFPPANDPFVITVGATDDKGTWTRTDDTLASFSAYGVAEGVAKPDVVAPGRFIIAPMAAAAILVKDGRAKYVEQDYYKMSGTSMSAPIVAGAAAILLEKEPNLTPDQVKFRLKNTATPFVSTAVAGAGLIDVHKSLNTYTVASANTGLPMSKLLFGGITKSWSSVSWNSVSWSSVSWSSVSWSSVSWSSDYVEP